MNNRKWMNKRTEQDCRRPLEVILGQPGCGKTFYMKKEIKHILSTHPEDKVIVFGERWDYEDLGLFALDPTEVKNANPLFVTKDTLMNLDLNEIVYQKTPLIASIFEATGHEINDFEVRAIWNSLKELYEKWRAEYDTMECPTLLDVYEILLQYKAPEYLKVATCLEPIALERCSILNKRSKDPSVSKEELQNNGLLIDIYRMIRNAEKTVSHMQNCNYLLKLYIDQIREQIEPETRIWVFIDELHPFFRLETINWCSISRFAMANDDFITDLYLGVKHDFYNKAGCFYDNTIFTVATQEIAEAAPAGLIQKAGFVTLFSTRIDQMDIVKKQTGLPDNISGILINQGPGMGLWYDKKQFYPFNISEF